MKKVTLETKYETNNFSFYPTLIKNLYLKVRNLQNCKTNLKDSKKD